jgi:putative ABC transport system substrate-binding protein
VVNLEQGDLSERLEEAVLFSLDFAGLDYEPFLLRPAAPEEAIERLAAAKPDLVVTIGAAGPRLADRLPPELPIIATAVGHPASFGRSRALFAGTSHYVPPARQLAFFRKIVPGLSRLGALVDAADEEALQLLSETREAARPLGIEIVARQIAEVSDLRALAYSLLPEVEGLLLLGGSRMVPGMPDLLAEAARLQRPVFAYSEELVRRGAVAALYADRLALAEEVGPMARQLLARQGTHSALRTPHSTFVSVRTMPIFKIALNLRSARAAGLRLPYTLLVIANEIVR